jgi:hypothetical protein
MPSVSPGPSSSADAKRIAECHARSVALLHANLCGDGILAAAPSARAASRGYRAVFARDAAVCAIAMALSGDTSLREGAVRSLATLAAHQADNGQIPKFVDPHRAEADFWYLGCVDATLWWLIAVDLLDRGRPRPALRRRFDSQAQAALRWLRCQEHQRFFLLQQNEASDWADIMPRSGFVLYSNALWYLVKRLYAVPKAEETRAHANLLFHPFGGPIAQYRRAQLLAGYARDHARSRDLYLSFVNFTAFGDEGDVFGNLLAVLCGVADAPRARQVIQALERERVDEPFPVRAVCRPIAQRSRLWRPYMARHHQNYPWQYHNGGIWPFVGGFWVAALAQIGETAKARRGLAQLARANALGGWAFREWLHGRSLAPGGMRGQSWNAAAFLIAAQAVDRAGLGDDGGLR